MQEKPRVVVSRSHRVESKTKDFPFTSEDLPIGQPQFEKYKTAAWNAYQRLGIPDVTMEAWRRTDLRSMPVETFRMTKNGAYKDLPGVPPELLKPLAADQHGGQVVITPNGSQVDLDELLIKRGVIFTDLRTALEKHPDLVSKILGQTVNVEEGKFAALAGAFAQNGIFLYVPANEKIEAPFHSILWGPGDNLAHVSHILVLLEEGASAVYVHESASPSDGKDAFHSGIVEIKVRSGASLKFVELQSWGRKIWNFSHERVRVERDGQVDWIFGAIGSHLTKNFSELDLAGEGAKGRMSGFYFTDGTQHLDHDTQQNHLAPHTTSDLLFKGALKGKSRSVWQGMIYVAKGAEKTDGYQANRNIVLEEGARADSIPGLDILADDVRCTHGATVGKLEQEPLFYIKSRGVPQKEAERIVVEGFFDPIMQRIPFEGVRERFHQAILSKME